MIRGIIFDFGNVICSFDVEIFLAKLHERSGLDVETLRDRIYGSRLHARYERGEVLEGVPPGSRRPYRRGHSGRDTRGLVLRHLYPPRVHARADPDTSWEVSALPALQHQRVALFAVIRKVPVFPLFDAVTLSFEVGALKPEPEIYLDALRKLSLPPETCVFIDDIGKYAEGAAVLGIRGIRYTGHPELLRELSGLGVVTP